MVQAVNNLRTQRRADPVALVLVVAWLHGIHVKNVDLPRPAIQQLVQLNSQIQKLVRRPPSSSHFCSALVARISCPRFHNATIAGVICTRRPRSIDVLLVGMLWWHPTNANRRSAIGLDSFNIET